MAAPTTPDRQGVEGVARGSSSVATVAGTAAGFAASTFGLAWPWLAALVLAVIGLVTGRKRLLLLVALGLAGGSLLYFGLGLAISLFETPATGSGSGAAR